MAPEMMLSQRATALVAGVTHNRKQMLMQCETARRICCVWKEDY